MGNCNECGNPCDTRAVNVNYVDPICRKCAKYWGVEVTSRQFKVGA